MTQKVYPRIAKTDYGEMRRQCPDLPFPHEEWLAQQTISKEHYRKMGYKIIDVLVTPQEIANHCKAMRLRPDSVILAQFAVAKHIKNSRQVK